MATLLSFSGKRREHLPKLGYGLIGVACTLAFLYSTLYASPESVVNHCLLISSPLLAPWAADRPSPPAPVAEPLPYALPRALEPGQKYLYYGRSGDWCQGVGHYMYSLQCALAEARFLGRTFAFDEQLCVPGDHNDGKYLIADIRFYYDVSYINRTIPLMSMQALGQELPLDPGNTAISYKKIAGDAPVLPYVNDTVAILHRDMQGRSIYPLCEPPEIRELLRPTLSDFRAPIQPGGHYNPPWKAVVLNILDILGPDFVAVHIRRGDKATQPGRWPHLDNDTRPESLLEKLPLLAPNATVVYIATDERQPGFFDRLKDKYVTYVLSDFRAFWSSSSDWARACRRISPQLPEFDGMMQGMVDYSILDAAKQRIETFNDLTVDDKHG